MIVPKHLHRKEGRVSATEAHKSFVVENGEACVCHAWDHFICVDRSVGYGRLLKDMQLKLAAATVLAARNLEIIRWTPIICVEIKRCKKGKFQP